MRFRLLLLLFLFLACLAAVPLGPVAPQSMATRPKLLPTDANCSLLPSSTQFAELAKSDVIAMLEASLNRYRCEVRGYSCTLQKQERVRGSLGKVEVVRVAFRDDPFAVFMKWERGAGLASATLYAKSENNGNLKAKTFLGLQDSDPNGIFARQSSRFTVEDFGIYRGTVRTHTIWKAARDRGQLQVEYLGVRPVPECNNRPCHVIRRTCHPPEVDRFSMDEREDRTAEQYPKEAILHATLSIDVESFLHVGSDIRHPDGSLIAAYYFRDIRLNPSFDRTQFLPAALGE